MVEEQPSSIVVSGVGKDSETCEVVRSAPGALEDGSLIKFKAPDIPNSTVPALCGMEAMDEHNMAPLPWSNQLVKVPKGRENEIVWPQGTTFIQCRRAKTGHMMLPIGHFNKLNQEQIQKNKTCLAFTSKSIEAYQQALLAQSPKLEPQVSHAVIATGTANQQ